jgi:hypothetical protein
MKLSPSAVAHAAVGIEKLPIDTAALSAEIDR